MPDAPRETRAQQLERRTAIWLASFTAFSGAFLGGLPDLFAGVWGNHNFAIKFGVDAFLLLVATISGTRGWRTWRTRNRILTARGSIYIVDSPAESWTPDEKNAYLASAAKQAAATINVPGPTGLTRWGWPLTERACGWSDAVDDLVLSFRSVWANDDRTTPDSTACWAPWPVAVAWAARANVAQRSLTLAIRQRPSAGRAGPIAIPDWDQPALTFIPTASVTATPERTCTVRPASVEITDGEQTDQAGTQRVTRVLLIRLHAGDWAGVPLDGSAIVDLKIVNHSGQALSRVSDQVEFHEWRYLLPPRTMHPWSSYEALVAEISDWILGTADQTGLTLIGMLVPQEVAIGIGINVSQRNQNTWPAHLWPLLTFVKDNPLTIPGLDLGYESLFRTYLDGPR